MIGWGIRIYPKGREENLLADWETHAWGINWIIDLVKTGAASNLGGNGYPRIFSSSAGILAAAFRMGLPPHDGALVIDKDYENRCLRAFAELDSNLPIIIEAWDLG